MSRRQKRRVVEKQRVASLRVPVFCSIGEQEGKKKPRFTGFCLSLALSFLTMPMKGPHLPNALAVSPARLLLLSGHARPLFPLIAPGLACHAITSHSILNREGWDWGPARTQDPGGPRVDEESLSTVHGRGHSSRAGESIFWGSGFSFLGNALFWAM
jgi:hypothetical protein